ncbi:histidine ammonia-lyase [Pedobacter flavus]|uniref:Histidine ammonia-lyase n=1 Tax=Pedobacter flavus TaxID=3113906 RepID=A0ABU7GZ30_9SPHI|nr:histidine ammonia-lyase [Pedobacter sp. VNH31]MEE1884268.1 histidine ammonia-lyase [Pedobacter sp. VNH31]
MTTFLIGSKPLTISALKEIIENNYTIALSENSIHNIQKCRTFLNDKINRSEAPIYGINTGFGYLQNVEIANEDLSQLQHNLLLSHACGTGERVPNEIVRLMLILKIQSLAYGHSGVALDTVQRLIEFYNHQMYPVIYTQGSLGASGDLAPLAHLTLPLIGEGIINYKGEDIKASEALNILNLSPLKLQSKEGLALINGTQFMSAYGTYILLKSHDLMNWANAIGAIAIDGFDARIDPFMPHSHAIRPHPGQIWVAQQISSLLEGSELINRPGKQTQDPYSFRCIPQVHGASKDTIDYVTSVFEREINSVTDNPNVFPDDDLILSAGNFHGQPLAITLDFLAIALSELGSISERRIFQLISGQRGLPPFLVKNAGLNSGLMITQYTAASIASENKQLCTPASADSIVSSNGQEDHVSMGANAATKCYRVLNNLERILSIELLTAAQALDLRKPAQTSSKLNDLVSAFRQTVSFNSTDRILSTDIAEGIKFINTYKLFN